MGGNYGDIDAYYYLCRGYYIIQFYSSPYNLQADLIIDGQVISSGQMVCEGNYFFSVNINYHFFLQKINPITQFFSRGNNQCQCQRNML